MRKIDQAYEFIKNYINENDHAPTIREIGDAIDIKSTSTVSYYLTRLEEENKIVKGTYKNRSIQLVENVCNGLNDADIITMPYIENICLGQPLMSEQNIGGKYMFSGSMFKGLDMFLMPVKDNLMLDSHIKQGDMVVVSRQTVARNGEIVVALVNGEHKIAKLYKEFEFFKLEFNRSADPIYLEKPMLLGKVVGVIRSNIE